MRRLIVILLILLASGCGSKQAGTPPVSPDKCKDSEGPTPDTVQRAITSVPITVPGATWVEIARGHAK